MVPACCTSEAPTGSEIPSQLARGFNVLSIHGIPREGLTRVFAMKRQCTDGGNLRNLLPFQPDGLAGGWAESAKVRSNFILPKQAYVDQVCDMTKMLGMLSYSQSY